MYSADSLHRSLQAPFTFILRIQKKRKAYGLLLSNRYLLTFAGKQQFVIRLMQRSQISSFKHDFWDHWYKHHLLAILFSKKVFKKVKYRGNEIELHFIKMGQLQFCKFIQMYLKGVPLLYLTVSLASHLKSSYFSGSEFLHLKIQKFVFRHHMQFFQFTGSKIILDYSFFYYSVCKIWDTF